MTSALPITAADMPWVPLAEGVSMRPLCFLDDGYSLQLRLEPGARIAPHRHTGEVDAIVLAGKRRLFDTDEVLSAGDFVHEPKGNHDSWGCEGDEPCIVQISLKGRVEYLTKDGRLDHYTDTHTAQAAYLDHCERMGVAPEPKLFRGRQAPRQRSLA